MLYRPASRAKARLPRVIPSPLSLLAGRFWNRDPDTQKTLTATPVKHSNRSDASTPFDSSSCMYRSYTPSTHVAVLVLDVEAPRGGLLMHGVAGVALDVRVDDRHHPPSVGGHLRVCNHGITVFCMLRFAFFYKRQRETPRLFAIGSRGDCCLRTELNLHEPFSSLSMKNCSPATTIHVPLIMTPGFL